MWRTLNAWVKVNGMALAVVRIENLAIAAGGLLEGQTAHEKLAGEIRGVFDRTKASDYDPLKVCIDFTGIEDLGVTCVVAIVQQLESVYKEDTAWYVTFSGLDQASLVYDGLSRMLKAAKLSIVCEPHARLFCGRTEHDLTLKGEESEFVDWNGTAAPTIDFLHGLGRNGFVQTKELLEEMKTSVGLGKDRGRKLLTRLDMFGVILQKSARGRNAIEWAHVGNYGENP